MYRVTAIGVAAPRAAGQGAAMEELVADPLSQGISAEIPDLRDKDDVTTAGTGVKKALLERSPIR